MTELPEQPLALWKVEASVPPTSKYPYRRNVSAVVEAVSVVHAVSRFLDHSQGATVHQVTRCYNDTVQWIPITSEVGK